MNKKTNTTIFMVVATIANLVLIVVFALIGLIIMSKLFPNGSEAGTLFPVALIGLCFILPTVLSWFIYSRVLKLVSKKMNLEDKLAPIFGSKKGSKKSSDYNSVKG